MILINEKQIAESVLEELTNAFKKNYKASSDGSYTIMYADRFYKRDKDNEIEAPSVMNISLSSSVLNTKGVTVASRFCNSFRETKDGNVYDTEYLTIRLERREKNVELLAWLYHYCPMFEDGLVDGNKMIKIEQKQKDAEKKVSNRTKEVKFLNRLYSGITESDVVKVAESLGIDSKTNTQDEMKTMIESIVMKDKSGQAMETFIARTEKGAIDKVVTPLLRLKDAEEEGVIYYKQKKWYLKVEGDAEDVKIKGVVAGSDPHETLYKFLKESDEDLMNSIFDRLDQVLADK